eukprot:TRINITY_DN14919_c0_g1_i1.p1 TRINITY_DN14919_c0_g1~~TRINITY_DN14919_c0_g1_i1.p1  ORF type:complete len:129 (+),score=29.01 TRINITY_DN14919_c0_g1_i1:116-502(+)
MFNGVRQLRKITIRYCDWGGSSARVREFINSELPNLQKLEPNVEISTAVTRNKHPILIAEYEKGRRLPDGTELPRVLELRQAENAEEIWERINFARFSVGMKSRPITKVKQTQTPSIQGEWNPFVTIQ